VQLLERIATLYEESLDAPAKAFETYGRAVAADSQNEQVLAAFERLARASSSWRRAAEIYDQQMILVEDEPELLVPLGLRAAQVYEAELADVESAIARYRQVLGAEAENRAALSALDRLYSQTEKWSELAEILALEAEHGETPDEILELRFRLGQVRQAHLGDVASAVQAYRDVLAAAPEHEDSRAALEGLFANGVRQVEIAEILEPLYQGSGEWEKLLSVREGQLANLTDAEARTTLLLRMAEEAEQQLVDGERAFGILVRALTENPAHEGTVDELERLAPLVEEGWEKLANAYADVLAAEGSQAATLAATGHRLARVFEVELGDVAKAEETHRFVLTVVPADLVSLENLDRLYSASEDWTKLAEILERRARAVSDEFEKVELYLRLGHTYEEKLAPLGGAAPSAAAQAAAFDDVVDDVAEDVVDEVADDEAIEPGLDDLISADDVDLAGDVTLEGEAPAAPVAAAPVAAPRQASSAAIAASLGAFNRARLDDAVVAYRVVFDKLQPENEDAIASLERIYGLTEQWKELDVVFQRELENAAGDAAEADVRAKRAHLAADRLGNVEAAIEGWKRVLDLRGEDPEALRALALLYEKQARWSELTDVLERHFDIAESDDDRVHVLTMRARLFDEQLNRPDEALETYQRVLDIDYANVTALRAIASIWRRRKSAEDLVRSLHALVDAAKDQIDAKEAAEAYREMAKLYQGQLEQTFEAAEAWRNLLLSTPGDFEALDSLEAIYRAEERFEEVVDVKMQRAAALPAAEEKVRELLEVTELWKSPLGEYAKAVSAYQKILEVEATHERAFKELEKLHTQAERWESLIELYLNRLEHYEEVPPRSDLLRRIARVFEEKLGDANQAFDALVNAFADDYFDEATSEYLEKVAQSTNRWSELLTTANAWLHEEQDRKRKIQLLLLLGRWYGENLGMSNYAAPYYQQVLQIDPQNVRVMRQMAAIERLAGNYQKVGQMLNKALEVAVTSEDRKTILSDLGDVLYRNLEQPDQAIPYYKRALEVDGGYLPALGALERIYEDKGQIPDLVEILTKKAGAIDRPEDAVRQRLRLGALLEERMNDAAGAAKAYREVIDIDPENLAGLRGLERTLATLADWPALVSILERQLEVVETEADRVTVLLRLAEIQEQQFLKADLAAARLEQALSIDPTQEAAYVALARCYRRLKQWNDLISTLQRHIDEATSRETKLGLYAQIGAVYRDELSEVEQAIDAFQAVVDADDTNIPALEALSKLYERQGEGMRAVETMTRVADLTSDGAQQVDMYFRIGRTLEEKLNDRFGAREKFERALDIDPGHLPSLAALRTIAVDEADWDSACRYLEQEQSRTEAPRMRAKLLVELGKIRAEMLSERSQAMTAYEQAIELDAECEEAALPLVQEYGEQERWADAAPLAEMLVRRSKNRERGEQQMLQKLLGKVMSNVGEHEKALRAYQAANQLDLTDQETIRGVADAAYALSDWPTALTNYQKVLTALGEDDVEARTEVYFRMGAIKLAQGQDKQAINNYEKALALDGEHRKSLEALVAIYEKSNDFKQVAEYKRQILDSVYDGEQRFTLLLEIGDLWAEREKDPKKAIDAYEEARDLKPNDHVLLHKMLGNYQSAEEWQKMVDTLDAIKEIEERPKLRAKFVYTQAQLYRDKLEDKDRAVELFNEALDLNPELLEAFERINKLLTSDKNWKQLERSYRKMLHRIAGKGNAELEHNLWHQLGLIYRDRTGQLNEAMDAFKMSASLVEEAPMQRQILAELYESSERWDDAIREQRRLLKIDPLAIEPYQALYRLYLHKQSYDEAWCLAAAMSFMRKADEETERFFQDFRPKGMLPVTGRLSNDHWLRGLFHPNESVYISNIFATIAPAALQAKLAQLRGQNKLPALDERFRQDPATSTVTFAKTFGWAAQVLGIHAPVLYVRNDVQAYIGAVPADPPSSIAGQLVLSGFQPQELTFICGKHLTSYRPEHYLRVLFPTQAELTIMLF
ncbi:MAG TPA: tetratricopeptide repeat protein, partial [Polyangiaceae bacterium]|nr:tetratricopeptide repeat protein [Polyangiaceae bacterium]